MKLTQNSAFMRLWAGQAASMFGFQIGTLAAAYVAVSMLHASAGQVGALNAMMTIAFLLVGLPAGVWVDHWRKRRVMIVADLVRAVAVASVPVAWALGVLTMWQMLAVAAVLSFASVFFDVAYQSYVPALVGVGQISGANARMEATFQVARIGGPGLAGWLMALISAPFTFVATAGTYVFSALAVMLIRTPEEVPEKRPVHLWAETKEGIDFVRSQPLLAPLFVCIAAGAFVSQGVQVLLPILALRELGMSGQGLGTLLSVGALGGLLGSLARGPVVRLLGEGHAIAWCNIVGNVVNLGLPLALYAGQAAPFIIVAVNLASSFFLTIFNITQLSLRQSLCPVHMLGRMNATFRFAVWGVMPLGAFAAGFLADHVGTQATLYLCVAGTVCAGLAMLATPIVRQNRLP